MRAGTSPDVIVRWAQSSASDAERTQAARDVVQTVLAERQRRVDAPLLNGVRATVEGERDCDGSPLGYRLDGERVVSAEWLDSSQRRLRLITDTGRVIEPKTNTERRARGTYVDVERPKVKRARRPATVRVRPGMRRKTSAGGDPTLGLDQVLPEIVWQSGSGGAWFAVVARNPDGNAIGCARLSGEDKSETLVTQVEGLLSLEDRYEELTYRYLVLAIDMSGMRPVRTQPEVVPPPGHVERDDMVAADRLIAEGWVEHIAWWSIDRVARKMLPALTLYERWNENEIGLWFVEEGRRTEAKEDELVLHFRTMLSASERNTIVRRMKSAALRKGPMAGNGHLNHVPYGFVRDEFNRLQQDPAVTKWIHHMFELADLGFQSDGVGLSAPKIGALLAEQGFSIDHDRVRTLLADPIYATGEWSVLVSGIEVPQRRIELAYPIPPDRFQRVQDWLALRQGSNENTPLGEFLFNYTVTVHKQCEGLRGGARDGRIRVSGYNLVHLKEGSQKLRHKPVTPECCKGRGRGQNGSWEWPRELLERPVVRELRRLVTHPDILKEAASIERRQPAEPFARLSDAERAEIARKIELIEQQREAAQDQWFDSLGEEREGMMVEDYRRFDAPFTKKLAKLAKQLEVDTALRVSEPRDSVATLAHENRLADFLEIMTETPPADPRMKALRARLFSLVVTKLVIDDDGSGPITITIEGPLVPPDSPVEMGNPLHAAGDFLDTYARDKRGLKSKADRMLDAVKAVKSDLESSHSKSVFTILPHLSQLPTVRGLRRYRRDSLASRSWHLGNGVRSEGDTCRAAWALALSIDMERALTIGLTQVQRDIIDLLRDQPVLSRTSLHLATGCVSKTNALQGACAALRDRGILATTLAPGHTGYSTLWCLTDTFRRILDGSASSSTQEGAARASLAHVELVEQPQKVPDGANPGRSARHERQVRRRVAALERASVGSISIADAIHNSGLTPEELIRAVDEARVMAVVVPGGEVRLPSWQFGHGFTVAQDLRGLVESVASRRVAGWGLHLAITKPSSLSRGPSVADELIGADTASRPAAVSKAIELMHGCVAESARRKTRRSA